MSEELPMCAKCRIKLSEKACLTKSGNAPSFCPTKLMEETIEFSRKQYNELAIKNFARNASIQEAECYIDREVKPYILHPVKPRIQEIFEFSKKMGYKRLGLAYCAGLQAEANALNKVLESHGFEVVSVACKVGCVPKEEIEIRQSEKIRIGEFESMCNPIAQAEILNKTKTDFNIVLGLCVGHDSLFFLHSKALTTVFAVKDRVTGHNPLASIYTLEVYYQRMSKKT